MFACLRVGSPVLRRRFGRRTPPQVAVTRLCGQGRNAVYDICVSLRSKREGFGDFCERFDSVGGKLLCADPSCLPEDIRRMLFIPHEYPEALLSCSAFDLIDAAFPLSQKNSIAVIDRRARFLRHYKRLFSSASQVRIITDKKEVYRRAAAEILQRDGAPSIVTADSGRAAGCTVVLAVDCTKDEVIPNRRVIASPHLSGENRLCPARVRLPDEYILPNGIDPLLYAAAVSELNGDDRIKERPACAYVYGGRLIRRSAAVELLMEL